MKAVPAILVSSALVVLFACSKDKFETKPRIEIKEYSTRDVPLQGSITFTLHYYDKEGDLGNAQFFARRVRINQLPLPPAQEKADSFPSQLPDFPDKQDGEIIFSLDYNTLRESLSPLINDSLVFRFAVTDRAGNKSDTLTSEVIVVHQ